MRMTTEEMDAVQRANRAEEMRTAMAEGTGSTGGFGIPIAIDPTINLGSNGAIKPIRALAQVRPMSTRELRLVSSDGVVAPYQAEAAEAIDNSRHARPADADRAALHQIRPVQLRGRGRLVESRRRADRADPANRDAKDVVEATKFLTGTGTNEPWGVLNIGAGGLTTTQRVQSTGGAAVAIAEVTRSSRRSGRRASRRARRGHSTRPGWTASTA